MLKRIMGVISIVLAVYILICGLMFVFQEKLIFFPQKLDKDYQFSFPPPFEEVYFSAKDEKKLHGLLFKSDSTKGLIFYLHGNAGSAEAWGIVGETYTRLNYDLFLLDYRGYGKSEGTIESEEQLFQDVQSAYDEMKKNYSEDKIIVLGYSIGTGPASKLASTNHAKMLILQAPYYSLTDVMQHAFPIVPPFLLKYKLDSYKYIPACKMPIVLFHGNLDEVIPYSQSIKLKPLLKGSDSLFILNGIGHNGMTFDGEYVAILERVLNKYSMNIER